MIPPPPPPCRELRVVLLFCFASVPSREQTQCCVLRLLWSLESQRPNSAFASWNSSTTIHTTQTTMMMTIYEIRHSRSRGKTATYAWKYGIGATTVFYTRESTHTVQAKPRTTLINTVFSRPLNSTLMNLRIHKTATYAWKYGISATNVLYTHESTHTI